MGPLYEEYARNNVYLQHLKPPEDTLLGEITTHCSGDLQKTLTFSDSDMYGNERAHLKEMAFKIVDYELAVMASKVKKCNTAGFAQGILEPGCILN